MLFDHEGVRLKDHLRPGLTRPIFRDYTATMTKREYTYHTAAYDLRPGFVVKDQGTILYVRIDGNYTKITWVGGRDETVRTTDTFPVVSDN